MRLPRLAPVLLVPFLSRRCIQLAALVLCLSDNAATLQLERLMRSFEDDGHRIASLDPLGILEADLDPSVPLHLTLEHHGFSDADRSRQVIPPRACIFF